MISRFGMDIFMGIGAVLIGIGTLMAIGGANHTLYVTSNYLSGYVGNAPLAMYAVVNAVWMARLFRIARHHGLAGRVLLPYNPEAGTALARRVRWVQVYTVASGTTNMLGGIGSLITAKRWWGYVILIPVIISSIVLNFLWRNYIGYQRGIYKPDLSFNKASLISEIDFVISVQNFFKDASPETSIVDSQSISSILSFIVSNDLFEQFCSRFRKKYPLIQSERTTSYITLDTLLNSNEPVTQQILEVGQICIREDGPPAFRHRERYLAEVLASYLSLTTQPTSIKEGIKEGMNSTAV
jgi:hypothetical protein